MDCSEWLTNWWGAVLAAGVVAIFVRSVRGIALRAIRREGDRILWHRVRDIEQFVCDLHDPLLQGMQGIVLKAQIIASEIPLGEPLRQRMEALLDQADVVIAQAVDRVVTLRADGPGLERRAVGVASPLSEAIFPRAPFE